MIYIEPKNLHITLLIWQYNGFKNILQPYDVIQNGQTGLLGMKQALTSLKSSLKATAPRQFRGIFLNWDSDLANLV